MSSLVLPGAYTRTAQHFLFDIHIVAFVMIYAVPSTK